MCWVCWQDITLNRQQSEKLQSERQRLLDSLNRDDADISELKTRVARCDRDIKVTLG